MRKNSSNNTSAKRGSVNKKKTVYSAATAAKDSEARERYRSIIKDFLSILLIAVSCVIIIQFFNSGNTKIHHLIDISLIRQLGYFLGIYMALLCIINEFAYLFYNRRVKLNVVLGYVIILLNISMLFHNTRYAGSLATHIYMFLISYFIYPLLLFLMLAIVSVFAIALISRNPTTSITRSISSFIGSKIALSREEYINKQRKKKEKLNLARLQSIVEDKGAVPRLANVDQADKDETVAEKIVVNSPNHIPVRIRNDDTYFFDQLKDEDNNDTVSTKKKKADKSQDRPSGEIERKEKLTLSADKNKKAEENPEKNLDNTLLFNSGFTRQAQGKSNNSLKSGSDKTSFPISKAELESILPQLEKKPAESNTGENEREIAQNSEIINGVLAQFNIRAEVTGSVSAPSFTTYELKLYPKTPIRKITEIRNEIAYNLSTSNIRILAPIPGKVAVGIELANKIRRQIFLANMIDKISLGDSKLFLGEGNENKKIKLRLSDAPHMLIAGSTGSGKSVCMHVIIISLLLQNTSETMKIVMIDPKKVEMSLYKKLPHLVLPIATNKTSSVKAIDYVVNEMERRYSFLSEKGCGDAKTFNSNNDQNEYMPKIVLIIDEFADLMSTAKKDVENKIIRIAQMGRAANIHLVLATQRPTSNVITGLIKSNIPVRIAFHTVSALDSRIILDTQGAEALLGKGDGLLDTPVFEKPMRFQCSYISSEDIKVFVEKTVQLSSS